MPFDFNRAVAANWPMKLTALALATVLWAAVAAEEPTTQLVPVTLAVEAPPGRVISQPLPPVQALFSGSAREIIKLYASPPTISQTIPATHDGPSFVVSLGVQDITFGTNANVVPQDVQPRQINVLIDSAATRVIAVEPRITVTPDSGYSLVATTISPESVTVTGPAAQVRALGSVHTEVLGMSGVQESGAQFVPLDTAALIMATLSHTAVELQFDITPIVERVVSDVPVRIVGAPGGNWTVIPNRVAITLRGPQNRLVTLTPDSVRVTVSPAGRSAEQRAALRVLPPAAIEAVATPDSALIRRVDRA